ncbi:unnamed protein product [Larinioides sclopetarius]|uniref:Uncharacterized protein n=1 Tax=Larinioides sclopetarius TaxID=280406 RepID=A0AAV1ZJ72_9ARAC
MSNRKKEKYLVERIIIKPKGRNSFSIPKKLSTRRRCSSKTMTRQYDSQEKKNKTEKLWTNEIEASSSTSANSSASVVGQEDSTLEIAETSNGAWTQSSLDDDWSSTDTSVEKMRSSEFLSSNGAVIASPMSFRLSDLDPHTFRPPASSTPRYHPNVVIDPRIKAVPKASSTLRSDVATQHGESLDLPNASYENEFFKESDTLEDEGFQLKSISLEKSIQLPDIPADVIKESPEQHEDEDFQVKSISLEQNIQDPDIPQDVIKENQEQREGSIVSNKGEDQMLSSPFKKHDYAAHRDSFACSEVPSSGGFRVSEESNEYTKQDFEKDDDKYSKNNSFAASVIDKSTNSIYEKRKDYERSSFEDMDDYSSGEDFGEGQSIKTDSSTEKGKVNSVFNRINDSISRWRQKNERINLLEYKSDSEDNFEKVQKNQNKELQSNEMDNKKPQTVGLQIKRKVKIFFGDNKMQQDARILNSLQSSTSLREHWNEGGNSYEDKDNSDDCLDKVQNIENEELQDNNEQENAIHKIKTNNQVKFASILSRSTNSNENKKHRNEKINSSEDVDNCRRADNFEKAETPKRKGTLSRNIKLNFSNHIKTHRRRKHTIEEGNSLENMDKNCYEDSFENVQNIPNEESQDNELDSNQPETAIHQIKRKTNKHFGVENIKQQYANITNRSQSSFSLKNEQKNEEENSFENMNKRGNESKFENVQKIQNKELQEEELNISNPQNVPLDIKVNFQIFFEDDNKKKQDASILKRSLNSSSLRRKHKNEENSFEDMDKNDYDDSFENVQNVKHEELQDNELEKNQPETVTRQINWKVGENVRDDNIAHQNANIANGSKNSISVRRKHKNEDENSFEDIDKNNIENCFENVQKIQNNEMQEDGLDNNHPQTIPFHIKRNVKIFLGINNKRQQNAAIPNRSPSSISIITKRKIDEENSFEDMDKNDNEDSFENVQKNQNDSDEVGNSPGDKHKRGYNFKQAQNREINTSKKKRHYKRVGVKRNKRVNRSRNAASSLNRSKNAANSLNRSQRADYSLNRSKNSKGREVSEGVQNSQKKAEKTNWPRCCIEASKILYFGQTFPILEPVFRDDIPIVLQGNV